MVAALRSFVWQILGARGFGETLDILREARDREDIEEIMVTRDVMESTMLAMGAQGAWGASRVSTKRLWGALRVKYGARDSAFKFRKALMRVTVCSGGLRGIFGFYCRRCGKDDPFPLSPGGRKRAHEMEIERSDGSGGSVTNGYRADVD